MEAREAYQLQKLIREYRPAGRIQNCMKVATNDRVDVMARYDPGGECKCGYRGVWRCGDNWGCPVCGRAISARRADEIERVVTGWQREGGAVALVTVTTPHQREDDYADLVDRMAWGWRKMKQGNPWKRIRDRHGIRGMIVAVESTYGEAAGWHPHYHAIFLVSSECDADQLQADLHRRWSNMAPRAGLREPSAEHGIDVSIRTDEGAPAAAAGYAVKGTWGVSAEATGQHAKQAKAGRYTPIDLVRAARDAREVDDCGKAAYFMALFNEYVDAHRGRHQLSWTPGLKGEYGVEELTDKQAAEDGGYVEQIASMGPLAWKAVRREEAEGMLLAIAQRDGHEGVAMWLARRGWDCGIESPPFLEALSPDMASERVRACSRSKNGP